MKILINNNSCHNSSKTAIFALKSVHCLRPVSSTLIRSGIAISPGSIVRSERELNTDIERDDITRAVFNSFPTSMPRIE
eukprot:gene24308-32747_t